MYQINSVFNKMCHLRGRPVIGADIKHLYDYRLSHFQNRCADKIIKFWNALFGSDAAYRNSPLCGLEQSPPTAHLICWESRVWPINVED